MLRLRWAHSLEPECESICGIVIVCSDCVDRIDFRGLVCGWRVIVIFVMSFTCSLEVLVAYVCEFRVLRFLVAFYTSWHLPVKVAQSVQLIYVGVLQYSAV